MRSIIVGLMLMSVAAVAQNGAPGSTRGTALDNDSIMRMVKAGLSESVIATLVGQQPGNYSVRADDLIALKHAGASDKIIEAIVAKTGSELNTAGNAAQHQPKEAAGSVAGALSGRVFLVTQGGDIKPARFARVELLYAGSNSTKDPSPEAEQQRRLEVQNSVGGLFLKEFSKRQTEESERLNKNYDIVLHGGKSSTGPPALECLRRLGMYSEAVTEALKRAPIEPAAKMAQVKSEAADEDGNFKIEASPGFYVLLATGRAGLNEAVWMQQFQEVKSGQDTAVKLTSPQVSCVADR
jgi:hypothetical protein